MIPTRTILTLACSAALCTACSVFGSSDGVLDLHTRHYEGDRCVEQTVRWNPGKTALVVCDMWDNHWCVGATRRVSELAGPMNDVLEAARQRGIFVIHAPSTTMEPYEGTAARRRAKNARFSKSPVPLANADRWGTKWCWPDKQREPGMPIDDSDMGCDCLVKCKIRDAWTRQIVTIRIDDADAVSDNGQEVYNLLAKRRIENVILLGVHLNMCVLGRPFGIRQMVYLKKRVVLMRDMTDTMYNSQMAPEVNHFQGTDLVIRHVEHHWCPTITSVDLVGGQPFVFQEDSRRQ